MERLSAANERQWFRVHVSEGMTNFVLRAYSEEYACLKVELFCQESPWIEEIAQFPLTADLAAKPLSPIEEDYYDAVGEFSSRIKLEGIEENNPIPTQVLTNIPGQLILPGIVVVTPSLFR